MNVIFAGAGVLLSVAMVSDSPPSDSSHTKPTQAAKDVIASQDALVDIFGRIENFFRRLEEYIVVPTTDGMKDIMVKIMVEVLGIFSIVTKEMKQGRESESILHHTFPSSYVSHLSRRFREVSEEIDWKERYCGRAAATGHIDAGGGTHGDSTSPETRTPSQGRSKECR